MFYGTIDRYNVECLECGEKYYTLVGMFGKCPHCGASIYDTKPLEKKEIEINLNPLTGEVTTF